MGCGCGKKVGATIVPPVAGAGARIAAPRATATMVYDVFDTDGGFVASFSNPVSARAEARRTAGTTVPRRSTDPLPVGASQ